MNSVILNPFNRLHIQGPPMCAQDKKATVEREPHAPTQKETTGAHESRNTQIQLQKKRKLINIRQTNNGC